LPAYFPLIFLQRKQAITKSGLNLVSHCLKCHLPFPKFLPKQKLPTRCQIEVVGDCRCKIFKNLFTGFGIPGSRCTPSEHFALSMRFWGLRHRKIRSVSQGHSAIFGRPTTEFANVHLWLCDGQIWPLKNLNRCKTKGWWSTWFLIYIFYVDLI